MPESKERPRVNAECLTPVELVHPTATTTGTSKGLDLKVIPICLLDRVRALLKVFDENRKNYVK